MYAELHMTLLELTKSRRRIAVEEVAEHTHIRDMKLLEKEIEQLSQDGFVASIQGIVELDSEHRMMIAERLICNGSDPKRISRLLEWQEFEDFAAAYLVRNGFGIVKHFVFKTRGGRREIDLIAWNDTFLLAIDCKHWLRGLSPSQSRKIVQAQIERAAALSERPDLLKKRGVDNAEKRWITPAIFCLADAREPIIDGVPVVAVSKLISFLYGVSPVDEKVRMIPVKAQINQSMLL